jgi:Tol biopolymer transport system component
LKRVIVVSSAGLMQGSHFEWKPDGSALVCVTCQPADKDKCRLVVCAAGGTTAPEVIVEHAEWNLTKSKPAFSPDGNKLYFDYLLNKTDFVAVRNMGNGSIETLFQGRDPAVSPDGKKICYIKRVDVEPLYVRELAPGAEEKLLTKNNDDCQEPTWSPDGRYIAFTRWENKSQNLFAVDVETGKTYRLTNGECTITNPCWAADGNIYFSSKMSSVTGKGIWRIIPRIDKMK